MADSNLDDLLQRASSLVTGQLSALVREAYQIGRADGGEAMRQNILRAAAGPVFAVQTHVIEKGVAHGIVVSDISDGRQANGKAPRGLLRAVVTRVLEEHPGVSITEAEEYATKADARVAVKSVGNEMRRSEGKVYHRDGRQWFLIRKKSETAGSPTRETPAASLTINQGGPNGTALVNH